MSIDRDHFEAWLRSVGYAETTVQGTAIQAQSILDRARTGEAIPVTAWPHARRMLRYAAEYGFEWGNEPALRMMASNDTVRVAERERRTRKKEAKSFDDASWQRLDAAIVADPSREARVLEILILTGIRISDALRIERRELVSALETMRLDFIQKGNRERTLILEGPEDPLYRAFQRALALWQSEEDAHRRNARDIATWIVPDSRAKLPIDSARTACYRRLREIGKDAKVKGRIHLHRTRRTIAVQGLRSGADILTVGQLLGHKPGSRATLEYLDEARPHDVAGIRQQVTNKFLRREEE